MAFYSYHTREGRRVPVWETSQLRDEHHHELSLTKGQIVGGMAALAQVLCGHVIAMVKWPNPSLAQGSERGFYRVKRKKQDILTVSRG